MTPIVDYISTIVTAMKVSYTGASIAPTVDSVIVNITAMNPSETRKAYVGRRFKMTCSDGAIYYGYISVVAVGGDYTKLEGKLDTTYIKPAAEVTCVITDILNFHHGHPQEIINIFKQATHKETVKFEQFPAICLFQDIPEKHSAGGEREATLNLVILKDTKKEYEASQRYTNTFKPILIPLYEGFIKALECSGNVQIVSDDYDYTERLYWGKSGLYGNTGNIFNDFIDAIELDKLKIKILK